VGIRVPGESGKPDTFTPLDELLATQLLDPEGVVPVRNAAAS
jgi:hypothetical protein